MDFASDNATGADEAVLAAIVAANAGTQMPYGADSWTAQAETALSDLFERDCAAFLVPTGTAANALALAHLSPPWGAIFCHADAHVMDDECGAPEFFSAGAKLVGLPGSRGRISPDVLRRALKAYPPGLVKQVQPAALSLTQATESGTLYSLQELAELSALAHAAGVGVHMDGARFANAVAALNCAPADMTWRVGIDVLSFGASKNGTLFCEAVIFFDKAKADAFAFRRKRSGHTMSKGRYLGAQMLAYLEGGRWLALAAHANRMAALLAARLVEVEGVRLPWACEANELFPVIPQRAGAALRAAAAQFYDWGGRGLEAQEALHADEMQIRLVTSFRTSEAEINRFTETLAKS
jgi:threonine aldolase